MAHVQYTYMIAYVYHSLSLVLCDRLQGRTCLCTATAGDLFVSWLLCTYNRDLPVSLSPESHTHLKCCICFRDRKKKSLFIFYCLCPVLDMCLSLFQVNLKIHLTLHREQKSAFWRGKNKVLLMLISFPSKNLKEREVRRD